MGLFQHLLTKLGSCSATGFESFEILAKLNCCRDVPEQTESLIGNQTTIVLVAIRLHLQNITRAGVPDEGNWRRSLK